MFIPTNFKIRCWLHARCVLKKAEKQIKSSSKVVKIIAKYISVKNHFNRTSSQVSYLTTTLTEINLNLIVIVIDII